MSAVFVAGGIDLPLIISGSGIGIVLEVIVGYGVIVFRRSGQRPVPLQQQRDILAVVRTLLVASFVYSPGTTLLPLAM